MARPIADAPPAMQSAVAAYEAGYAAMIDSKRPIQSEIDLLQTELERGELMVAVPQGAKAIEGMSSDDAEQLADKTNGDFA